MGFFVKPTLIGRHSLVRCRQTHYFADLAGVFYLRTGVFSAFRICFHLWADIHVKLIALARFHMRKYRGSIEIGRIILYVEFMSTNSREA